MCKDSPGFAPKEKHDYRDLAGKFCPADEILGYDSGRNPIRADFSGFVVYDKDFPNHFLIKYGSYVPSFQRFYARSGRDVLMRVRYLIGVAEHNSSWNRASKISGRSLT